MAGYRLELAGLACAGAVACGPAIEEAATEGGGASEGTHGAATASDGTAGSASGAATRGDTTEGTEGSSSQGYPLTGGSDPETDTWPEDECAYRGDICGEFLVCQCSCDIGGIGCCTCEPAACTEDAHCGPDEACMDVSDEYHWVSLQCAPAECANPVDALVATADDAASLAGLACLASLTITGPGVPDLSALEGLVSIDGPLTIEGTALNDLGGLEGLTEIRGLAIVGNPMLTDIGALFELQHIGTALEFSSTIRDNPNLPAADVHAWLESIDRDSVEVCGNLDDVPCP